MIRTSFDDGPSTWQDRPFAHATLSRSSYIDDDLNFLVDSFGYLRNVESISFTPPEQLRPSARPMKLVQYIQKGL